ncbi:Hypothetical predicted protein [Cloeon dipterum]|uniref:G domain-containing protein n=1 Tax=Cloeon dipterum TaxID=197152 RepID=A0A8S1DRM0_9INSE|nr:Hypothetical predicted protein [Cloeon dipterum]
MDNAPKSRNYYKKRYWAPRKRPGASKALAVDIGVEAAHSKVTATRNDQELDSLLRYGVQSIDMLGADEFIVLVGCTGSGKSTFLKFFLKDPTLSIALNRQEDCIFIDGETTIGSENSLTSKTLMPNLRNDMETGLMVLDCAGFEDTRSEQNDLIASFLNKTVLDKAKRIKLVIVESYEKLRLNVDRNAFMNVLSNVSGLLKYNYRSFRNSICLVATKIESVKDNGALIRSIKTFFDDAIKGLEEKYGAQPSSEDNLREMEILRFMNANSRIGLFRRPTEVAANPWGLPALQKNFKSLRKLVFQDMEYTPDDCGKFNIVVAPKTQIWVRGPLIEETVEDLKRLLATVACTIEKSIIVKVDDNNGGELEEKFTRIAELGELITVLLSSIQSPEDLEDLAGKEGVEKETIEELRYQTKKTIFLFGVAGRDESEIKDLIVGLNGGVDAIISKVKALVETNRFIVSLAKDAESHEVRLVNDECMKLFKQLNATNFQHKMVNLRRLGFNELISTQALNLKRLRNNQINDLKAWYTEKNGNFFIASWEGDCLLVLGRYVFLSQVLKEIYYSTDRSQIKQVVVATTQKLYIDCDQTLKHTHLSLIAPLIEIVKEKRVITLIGEDGVPHYEKQAPKSKGNHPGQDGLHGNPGFSSGSFTLIALDVLNSSLLEVRSKGGSGNDGQHGGNGKSASPCPYPVLENIDGPVAEAFTVNQYIINHCAAKGYEVELGTAESMHRYLYAIGMGHSQFNLTLKKIPDDHATDGGRGGDGGSLALAGEMNLRVQHKAALKRVSVTLSKGENGEPGKGGRGGRNAKGKLRLYKCMYRAIAVIGWRVTVDQLLEQGEYDCGLVPLDGRNGSVNEGNNLRYKYSEESLLPNEKIAQYLSVFAAEHNFDKDPSFSTFKIFLQQNFS